jgi:hypothetical protein
MGYCLAGLDRARLDLTSWGLSLSSSSGLEEVVSSCHVSSDRQRNYPYCEWTGGVMLWEVGGVKWGCEGYEIWNVNVNVNMNMSMIYE